MRATFCKASVLRNLMAMAVVWWLGSLVGCAGPAQQGGSVPLSSPLSPRLALAYAYYENGQYPIALDESRKVLAAQPEQAQAMALQGLVYARLNETALAQRSFQLAEQWAMQDADIAHNHGWFLCQQHQYGAAFERFARAMQQPFYGAKAKTLWVWGVCAQQSGDESAAQALWLQSLSRQPSAQAALALAHSFQQHHQLLRAASVLGQVNSTDAASPETLWLGLIWARKMGDTTAVQAYASQLQRQFPHSSQWQAFQRGAFDE